MSRSLVVCFVMFLFACKCDSADQCEEDPNYKGCVCTIDNKRIDLRSIGLQDGTARFHIPKASDGSGYYYNPCYPFTAQLCDSVAGCQNAGGAYRSIGSQDQASFNTNDKRLVSIAYEGGNGGRNMVVNLVCGLRLGKLDFVGETAKNQYSFNLTTVCACPGACDLNGLIEPLKEIKL